MEAKVKVYCGISIEGMCSKELHPVNQVEAAKILVLSGGVAYSNHPDFIAAVKYIGERHGVKLEFFLDGVSQGDEIDAIFEDLNRALVLINKYLE